MSVEIIEVVGSSVLGEGPHWDAKTKTLYYVDIFDNSVHKFHPESNKHCSAKVGKNNLVV